MANSREAPNFIADPSGFDTFFEDVEELAKRADLPDSEKIRWACRYAGSESDSWRRVPCLNREGHSPTFDEFKKQVLKGYPQLSHEDRYTIRDLQRLTDRTRDYRDMGRDDLGDYYRRFVTYSSYLIDHDRFSQRERSLYYLKGFPHSVRSRIMQRLTIKQPDVRPDEGYKFEAIHEAAVFVLSLGIHNFDNEFADRERYR